MFQINGDGCKMLDTVIIYYFTVTKWYHCKVKMRDATHAVKVKVVLVTGGQNLFIHIICWCMLSVSFCGK